MTDRQQAAASRLLEAYASGRPCEPVRDLIDGVDSAYAVQHLLTERWLADGRRLTGRKIGLTSRAVQRQLGVDSPDFGVLLADMAVPDGEEIPAGAVLQPRAEAEVALVLERDLTHGRHTVADVIRATAFALPAIEVVGSRIRDWDITLADTVADNASAGMYVLGTRPVLLRDVDLRMAGMVIERRGEQVSTGVGAACLGHPLHAAVWLADTLARLGTPLRAGDTVLTGALGPVVPVKPGDVLEARIDGLGDVRTAFAHEEES
ncbi:2-keto-4-pentenoate hydratase [Streptosporangium becharense]|uniref:2-keto-4-pentenoate hydratase n=1 Tax=Streptosporangium becharense TaxID=1816182 RepID=A0A7W9MIQ7_9ACTN|nr:fumarylacetoacetate hydrolase family protein [Streptosporangium becharense]MBB2913267.1 2-keto-4-pentenoate hydratase [Streptosporangium becharense]MBB5822250.1 2-keto-4-pentenoate hydratase [Streptosporangium becharense]